MYIQLCPTVAVREKNDKCRARYFLGGGGGGGAGASSLSLERCVRFVFVR